MPRGTVPVVMLLAVGLFGCGVWPFAQRDPWRDEAEAACLAANPVRASAYLEPASNIGGRGVCGMTHPFRVAAIGDGTLIGSRQPPKPVSFASRVRSVLGIRTAALRGPAPSSPTAVTIEPRATLACPLITAVDRWVLEDVQPAALAWLGEPVVEMKQLSSYACRSMNGQPGAAISEHAFGNALDIALFRLASGREVAVKTGWRGRPEERGFLRQVHAAACERFSTVLGPGADAFHYDHFHLDLARRASGNAVCKPVPQQVAPPTRPFRTYPGAMPMTSRDRDPFAVTATPAPRPAPPRTSPPARYSAPPSAADPIFANRPIANLAPPDLAAPEIPARPGRPAPAAGVPLDLAPPQPHARPGLRPPAGIPSAGRFDPTVTGSIDARRFYQDAPAPNRALPSAVPGED
jgi:hypothetical protein